jgi:DNA-binding LacI/PurR family transcriptional regulator
VTNLDTYLADFADGARPMVVVNNYLPEIRLNHVKCDYEQAGMLAGDHLLGLGHRHLALIHGASEVQTTSDLKRGFTSALARMDLHLTEDHSVDGLYTEEGGALAVTELMRRHPDLTGILAGNDKMAIGAISGLKNLGLRVPEEVSVIGCDDMHQAEFSDPPLTTIHTPIYKLGQRACELVLQLIEGVSDAVEETHPVALTLRKSTCPPPQSR